MGYFNKIFIHRKIDGKLIDITLLDREHYESFLDAMLLLNEAYRKEIDKHDRKKRKFQLTWRARERLLTIILLLVFSVIIYLFRLTL